ncbi:hypothetical protein BJY59DRAFT_690458 [Rhodotorula toruloides]
MERRRSVSITRPDPPIIRPIPIRPGSPSTPSKPTPGPPARPPSPASSRTSPTPPRPLSRSLSASSRERPPSLVRPSSLTASKLPPRAPSPARAVTYPPARPPLPSPAGPSYLSRSASSTRTERPHVSFNLPPAERSQPRTPSPAPLSRSRSSTLPTPPPSRPASIPPMTFSVFFDPSRPPPVLNLKEGETLPSSNICRYRNKIRSPMAFWEQGLAYRMQQSIWEAERLLKERFPGPRDLYDARGANGLWIEAVYEPVLAVLRMMEGTYHYFVEAAKVANGYLRAPLQDKRAAEEVQRGYLKDALPLLEKGVNTSAYVGKYFVAAKLSLKDDLAKQHADAASAQRRLASAWRAENAAPLSALLRKEVQQVWDRSCWYQLQWRAITFEEAAKKNKDARVLLGREVERTLNALRRQGAISGQTYFHWFGRLEQYLPPESRIRMRQDYAGQPLR